MKKAFKISILLLACAVLLFTGCNSASASLPGELIGQTLDAPDVMNIIAPSFFSTADADNAEQVRQQWLEEMSERYETEFNILSLTFKEGKNVDSDAMNKAYNVFYGHDTFAGLIEISDLNVLQIALDNNVALPLEDYLADNPVWNALPDDLKSSFEYQGHIYAIPIKTTQWIKTRLIKDDALKKTGVTVTDLDSLREFALAYAKKTGEPALRSFRLDQMVDILNAFGLYSEDAVSLPFSYDPAEDCITDFLTKDAAIDALEYLRELNAAGAVNIDFDDYSAPLNSFNDGTCPSYYRGYNDQADCTELLTLNPAYPQVLVSYTEGYIMTKDTPQPKETINLFVNMLFGSEQNYLECWLGSSDNYIQNSDGTITVKMVQNADGQYVYPCTPDLTGGLSGIFPCSDARIIYSQDGVLTTDSETKAGASNQIRSVMYEALQTKTAVRIPPLYSMLNSPSFYAQQRDILYLFENCILDAITDTDYTVQEIIEQYRLDLFNMGGNKILDEMNAAIGKKTAYYYG